MNPVLFSPGQSEPRIVHQLVSPEVWPADTAAAPCEPPERRLSLSSLPLVPGSTLETVIQETEPAFNCTGDS